MHADDRQLVRSYSEQYEEGVFAAIVDRHGPMVMGVCRRLLGDAHSAEDAFQATFFTLAHNAASIRRPESLASWLHGVAWRVARRLLASRTPNQGAIPAESLPDLAPGPATQASWREIAAVLDEEVQRLPEKYRLPLVLCHLEGMSQAEAARTLDWPVRSLSSRLERGAERLRQRLSQRGVTLSAAALTAALGENARAAVLPVLSMITIRTARLLSLGQAEAARQLSASAVGLAEGVWHAMWLSKMKMAGAVALVLLLTAGALGLGLGSAWSEPADPAQVVAPPPVLQAASPEEAAREKLAAKLADLAHAKLVAAREEFVGRRQEFMAGRGTLDFLQGAALRVLEAELALENEPAGQVAAHERYWKVTREVEDVSQARYQAGRIPITDLAQARYYRLDAEYQLVKARALLEKP